MADKAEIPRNFWGVFKISWGDDFLTCALQSITFLSSEHQDSVKKGMDSLEFFESANLTTRQRRAYELVILGGHSLREATKIMGLSRSTVYYHISKAVEKIRALQAEKEAFERIRRLEERINKLEQNFLKHVFEDHILKDFLGS
jgi:DNA-binding CsgD family transcriptional regulator